MYLIPDVERILIGFLLARPEVAALAGSRVYATLPAGQDTTVPTVRAVRWGGRPVVAHPLWLDRADVQLDAWAGTKSAAHTLAETLRAVCADHLVGVHAHGVVSAVEFGPLAYRPDDVHTPPRPRYVLDVAVTAHPTP